MNTVWRVFAYLKRYPGLAAGTLACAILGTLMVIVFPSVTKWIIDDVVRANRPDKLLPLILLATVAFLVQHLFNSLRIILNNTFEQKVILICAAICIRTFNCCRCAGSIIGRPAT